MAYPDQRYWRPATEQPYGNGRSGGPSPEPGPGLNLAVGLALLLCSVLCLGLLFFGPTRLLALLLVLPIGASVLYVWFRDRARTNAALTVGALAILSIAVGLGVAMIASDRQSSAPQPRVPLVPTSGEPSLSQPAPAPSTPAARPTASHAPAPAPAVAKHPAPTTSKPAARDHEAPAATRTPESSRASDDADSDDDRRGSDRRDREQDRDRHSDRDSDRPREEPAAPRSCNFGDVRINPDGTGDVCADSNGEGGYAWRRNQRIPD